MRATVTFDDDVAAAIEQERRDRSLGVSEVVNELVRPGLAQPVDRRPFVQKTYDMGRELIDISNVAATLEAAEGPA